MLNRQMKKCLLSISGLVLAASSSLAWSQAATVCTNIGGSTPTTSIAVASNFYEPAQSIATGFLATPAGSGKVIRVCHNSTTLLVNEINAGSSTYALFLAANTDGPTDINAPLREGLPFTYAQGIPVLWSANLTSAQLMSSGIINKTNVTSLAIGNPALAPYGVAAQAILDDLGQWEDQPSSWITEYDNIALTKTAIQTGSKIAGFVSKAQVCQQLGTGYGYHQFAASFNITQNGVLLNQGDKTTAAAFKTYLLSTPVQTSLVTNFCYASPALARKAKRKS